MKMVNLQFKDSYKLKDNQPNEKITKNRSFNKIRENQSRLFDG